MILEWAAAAWDALKSLWTWALGAGVVGNYIRGRLNRGRNRVDEAAPRLIPLGNGQMRPLLSVRVRNEGTGRARHLKLAFAGREAEGGEVAAHTHGETAVLSLKGVPFWKVEQGPEPLVITCRDDFENEYRTMVPVHQEKRADGEFNMKIDWTTYTLVPARPRPWRFFQIGR